MNSPIKISPNATTNELVTAYKSNPEYGYVILKQDKFINQDGWVRKVSRSTITKGEVESLKDYVAEHTQRDIYGNPPSPITGQLIVKEYVESEVPGEMLKAYVNQDVSYEEGITSFVKRVGKDGPEITLGGERILRFTVLTENISEPEVRVAHDNVEALAAWRAEQKAVAAKL